MVKLSTQPTPTPSTSLLTPTKSKSKSKSNPIKLRSNFYALPITINSNPAIQWIYSRPHSTSTTLGEEGVEEGGGRNWFVTGLPVGVTEKSLKSAFKGVGQIERVEMIPSTNDTGVTVLSRERVTQASDQDASKGVTPLFNNTTDSDLMPTSTSAIISFSPTSPPPPFPPVSTVPINFKLKPISFLERSLEMYQLARPHLSTIITHSDTWMSSFDLRKLSSLPPSYNPSSSSITVSKKEKKKSNSKLPLPSTPLPGSASHALSLHLSNQLLTSSKSHNPDASEEGEWTLVSRGGKHGKSLLPEGAIPDVAGYGGVSVGVSKRVWEGEEEETTKKKKKESGVVGDGFYRFTKEEGRREELLELKRKFEEDRRRLGGGSRGGRGGGFGGTGGRGGGSSMGSSTTRGRGGGSGSNGRDKRAYKPY